MIEFRIKEKTHSLNESFRGDWRPRAAAAKRQRTKAMQACPEWPGGPLLVVRLTRVSPGTLDKANLAGSLKHIEDGIAARLGVDDASPLVEWLYHQEKGEAEVVVQIWNPNLSAPPLPPMGRPVERRRHRCNKSGCKRLLPCAEHSHHLLRLPGPAYTPPEAARMHASATRAAAESISQADDRPALRAVPRGSRTSPMATKAVEPSNVAEHRALLAAQEAEATFAPEACGCLGERHSNECVTQGRHL